MPDKKKVLVTGFGGRIGKVLRDHLGDKYEFSGIDRIPLEGLDSLTADLTDLQAIAPAFEGKDVVVHLAAEPRHTPDIGWDLLMPDNVIATANVFEAAKQAGVSRIIFFSSMHVVGMYERDQPYTAIVEGDYDDLDPATVPLITHDMPRQTRRPLRRQQDIRRSPRSLLRRRPRHQRHLHPFRHYESRRPSRIRPPQLRKLVQPPRHSSHG